MCQGSGGYAGYSTTRRRFLKDYRAGAHNGLLADYSAGEHDCANSDMGKRPHVHTAAEYNAG